MSALVRTLTIATSGTGLEDAHRELERALGQGEIAWGAFDAAAYDEDERAAGRAFWRDRMEREHRSVHVFLLLGAQLLEASAPLDAKTVMLRLAQDELRHTELCGRVVELLGGEASAPSDVAAHALATHAGVSLEERALRNVIYTTCLSEMVAVGRLVDALEGTTDPVIRAATRAILADEVLHGKFGFLYLEWARPSLGPWRASLERYLRLAFATLEREMVPPAGTAPVRGGRLGVIDPARAREIFYATVEAAIVPGLERFDLDATAAWRGRTMTP